MNGAFRAWLEALPKAELHLHLEGAIPLPALWRLMQKYGGDREVPGEADLRRRLSYRDFADFIDAWIWKNGFLREYEDFSLIAEAMARELLGQNIRYAEVFFSPSRFSDQGLEPQELVLAIERGLARVPNTTVRLIADMVRDTGPEQAARTLEQVAEVRQHGVIGIGLGGSEHRYPPEPFAGIFERARRLGLGTTAHAGEAAGADSVRGVLDVLAVDRIGHGVRAAEDPALLDLLAARGMPLEVCPLSNIATGVVAEIAQHPVGRFWRQGLMLTINTDDPGMFHNTLADEFLALHQVFGFGPEEIRNLVLNAVEASWQDAAAKSAMREAFIGDPAWSAP
ncbi:MAG: adenosine deaminase [Alphaproteobacteria bacterium]|nr:adenosine deaminase [Alphaproteobacteria bacterium]MDP6812218.1 adenosine deaminase [Alphaproteobacteria bacterium]